MIVRQRGGWRDRWRAYDVEVDRAKVGRIGRGQKRQLDLAPGVHEVRLVIDWCSSQTLQISGDEDTTLHCAPGGTALTVLPDILIRTDQYITFARE